MIAERLRQIKSKAEQSGRHSGTQSSASSSQASSTSSSTQSTPSTAQPLSLSPAEIAQLTTSLNSLRPQIPQIDKLIQLHSKASTAPEVLKKLVELRNILVNQIEMASVKKSFFLTHAQLSLLTEQIQKVSSHLNSRLKDNNSTSTSSSLQKTTSKTSSFERSMAQKLSLSDDFQMTHTVSHATRFLTLPTGQMTDLRFSTLRNQLLNAECDRLEREEGYRIHRQSEPFGRTSLLVTHPNFPSIAITFLLPLLYSQTELLYRIEGDSQLPDGLLPSQYEPEHAPFTISTILRRYHLIKSKK